MRDLGTGQKFELRSASIIKQCGFYYGILESSRFLTIMLCCTFKKEHLPKMLLKL